MQRQLYLFGFTILILLQACRNNSIAITAAPAVSIDTAASCPHLITDAKGNIVLSWVKQVNDSTNALCYAISADQGQTFGQPVVIPHTAHIKPHGENMPKLIVKPSGGIIAMWGEASPNPYNKYAGRVFYAQSFDGGKSWSAAQPLVTDTASYDQRYFDMALLKNGEAAAIWLDNRKEPGTKGSSLYFAATAGNSGFTNEKRIGESTCECCRTSLLVEDNGYIHVLYRDIIQDSIRDMVHAVSADGRMFTAAQSISPDNWVINGCPHSGPAMTANRNGLHFAWYTGGNGKGVFYCRLNNKGGGFSPRESVSPNIQAKHPQIAALPDGQLLVTWDETIEHTDGFVSEIGIEQRDATGKPLGRMFISDSTLQSSFPVMKPIGNNKALIAYTQTDDAHKSRVVYQLLNIEN